MTQKRTAADEVLTIEQMKTRARMVLHDLGDDYTCEERGTQIIVRHPTLGTLWVDLVLDAKGYPRVGCTMGPGDGMRPVYGYIAMSILFDFSKRLNDQMKAPPPGPHIFRKKGRGWHVEYGTDGRYFNRPYKGFALIAHLLSHPGTSFWARELEQAVEPPDESKAVRVPANTLEWHGLRIAYGYDDYEVVDAATRADVKRVVKLLKDERQKAIGDGDGARADTLKEQIEAIISDHKKDTRPGGKSRRFSDEQERSRKRVWKAIDEALGRLSEMPALHDHLQQYIVRGSRLCYAVEPSVIRWQTAAEKVANR